MAKKSKFMSWLGFGKSDKKQAEADKQQALAKEQAEKAEQERLAAEQAEAERLQAEAEAERIEQARIAAEQDRLAQEQAEKAEQERLAAEQAAAERLQAEAEAERLEQEKQAQAQRAAAEEKQAIEHANAELLAKQQADAEQQRQEQAKRLAEQEAQMQLEQERIAAEKAENERLEQQRIAAEQAENERLEQQRIAAEQAENERLEQQRIAAEQAENERLEQQRIAAEQAENERLEQQRIAAEQAENERLEQQRIAAEQAENERLEQQRIAAEQAENERLEQQRIAAEQAENERLEQQRIAAEQAENERLEQQRIAAEQAENERLEQERLTAELAKEEAIKAEKPKKEGFFSRLKKGLLKTRVNIGSGFASIFSGKKIDDELFEELETQLLTADLGVDTTMKLIDSLTDAADRKQLKDGDALYELMKQEMATMLKTAEQPLEIPADKKPFVILMVGVNGVGKTTTIGKMAKQFQNQGKSVMLAAGDTFRAAAVEQLQVWGERNSIPVIAQHTGADSASVVFDAFQAAKARNVDVLIADTAGRLQNKDNLMQELEKIARVMKKVDPDAPHEVMLTIDAGTGQNAISQVNLFNQCVGLTGITLSKLDGTAKGGVIFAVADKFNIPIRYIGVGESIDDLRTFKSDDFIDALFSQDEDDV
ncbi:MULTISPECIES: signal recognition particle-docking protein FtsY [unclassified Pseudoalteromonas]|uniref:signal recognition particle-docking protein FtsY n=1 Tax=unclassified Pseudoalteromonas TaxID=194690 RepID=UPI0025B2EC5A|nr:MULTISPECIES: signal recognition particle-docking protein FtsY [unclassified Pseudoalteromonas]MDN3421589.1 signal recognition particle-docking protein FtsY [Pseudoalteromonas sp. APC 3895]MDN3424337.1 signal recognition particle-docking protein FtsY [Pseudoalteromonas sp. APC 3896]